MKNIKTNIKKTIKQYEKEHKTKLNLNEMWRDWHFLSYYLNKNKINSNFLQIEEGDSSSTIATYYILAIQKAIILDWDVSSQYEDEKDLIDSITKLEEEGQQLEQSLKNTLETKKDLTILVEYSLDNEKKHYQESNKIDKKTHIFKVIKRINQWLK